MDMRALARGAVCRYSASSLRPTAFEPQTRQTFRNPARQDEARGGFSASHLARTSPHNWAEGLWFRALGVEGPRAEQELLQRPDGQQVPVAANGHVPEARGARLSDSDRAFMTRTSTLPVSLILQGCGNCLFCDYARVS